MTDIKPIWLSKARAAEHLGCSVEELLRWVRVDRTLPDDGNPATQGMRLWAAETLDRAKPQIDGWRERDRIAAETRDRQFAAQLAAEKARRRGMKKARAKLAGKVCKAIGCTRTELDRWAEDGRLPPDGEIVIHVGKAISARAWLPATIEAAKDQMMAWREQDNIRKTARRKELKIVR
jgi:hypothetical protein